jgi:hypothetical protein
MGFGPSRQNFLYNRCVRTCRSVFVVIRQWFARMGRESERNGGQRSESCTGRRLAWSVGVYRYMECGPVDIGVVIILLIGEMHDGNAGLSCEQNSTVCNGSIGNFAMSYRVGDHGAECTVRSKSCAHRRCKRPPFTALEQRLSNCCWNVGTRDMLACALASAVRCWRTQALR